MYLFSVYLGSRKKAYIERQNISPPITMLSLHCTCGINALGPDQWLMQRQRRAKDPNFCRACSSLSGTALHNGVRSWLFNSPETPSAGLAKSAESQQAISLKATFFTLSPTRAV